MIRFEDLSFGYARREPLFRQLDLGFEPGNVYGLLGAYMTWFYALLFGLGLYTSSRAFRELHDKTRNEPFLLLPASALEKTLARLLLANFGFVLYLLVLMTLASLLTEGVNALLFGQSDPTFAPFSRAVWMSIGYFVVLQSMFFLGAAWFRSHHFVKTLLALVVLAILLTAIAVPTAAIVLGPYVELGTPVFVISERDAYDVYLEHKLAFDTADFVAKAAVFVALPLFCWAVAWLRVKETQASDGV